MTTTLDDLIHINANHHSAFPDASPEQRARFITNTLEALTNPVPVMAQDAFPLGLQGKEQNMPFDNNGNFLKGNYANRDHRTARDQLYERRSDMSASPADWIDQSEDQEAGNLPDPPTCARFIEMMLNSHAAHDAEYETTGHNELMQLLAQILQLQHNGNGDNGVNRFGSAYNGRGAVDRRRTARDQSRSTFPGGGSPPSGSAPSLDRQRARDRHPAQDAAIGNSNVSDFASRFPDAMKISVRG